MSFDLAVRLTEIGLGWAFLWQSLEHLFHRRESPWPFAIRFVLSMALLFGFATDLASAAFALSSIYLLHRFQGAYNGGCDRMGLLLMFGLAAVHWLPGVLAKEAVWAYLGAQLTLSYFISGWVKVTNPDWRSGRALRDVFSFSAYPACEQFRRLADWPRLIFALSWAVILLELAFPLALIRQDWLLGALFLTALFHLANAVCFGLNRFFWIWIAAYPSLIWLQGRLVGG